MGNNGSIQLIEKSNGIYEINVKDYPDYPIVYIRLCWIPSIKKYCIPGECDVKKDNKNHRKIIVVGIKLLEIENIFEQSFYLSTGLNSISSLEKFFTKLIYEPTDNLDIWLPFSGFGYDLINSKDDFENKIKLMKTFFDCDTKNSSCLYGRFGKYNPNLMQISYCLGGKFWDNNIDIINKQFDIKKIPTLNDLLKKINYNLIEEDSNINCSKYLNNYIASAIVYNYSPELLFYKNRIKKYFNYDWFDKLKVDFRILNILNEKNFIIFIALDLIQ
jgi:hypothetical protein